jgi:hypothetical protein
MLSDNYFFGSTKQSSNGRPSTAAEAPPDTFCLPGLLLQLDGACCR